MARPVLARAAGHHTQAPALRKALAALGREVIQTAVGGVIPTQDHEGLLRAGATAIFGPGTVIPEAAVELIGKLEGLLGKGEP